MTFVTPHGHCALTPSSPRSYTYSGILFMFLRTGPSGMRRLLRLSYLSPNLGIMELH